MFGEIMAIMTCNAGAKHDAGRGRETTVSFGVA